jgi:hypothetical protein
MTYYEKYLKYKNKYIFLKNQLAGANIEAFVSQLDEADLKNSLINLDFFFNYNKNKNSVLSNFSNFTNYNLVNSPVKRIGTESNNGFINLLEFKLRHTSFLTVMKSSLQMNADNNYYEYIVGNCINKIKSYLPNFVYTFNYMNLNKTLLWKLRNFI